MEHIPTEISFKAEFYKDNLCFTKMATLAYVSHWDVDLGSLFLNLGGDSDHLDQWNMVQAKLCDFQARS